MDWQIRIDLDGDSDRKCEVFVRPYPAILFPLHPKLDPFVRHERRSLPVDKDLMRNGAAAGRVGVRSESTPLWRHRESVSADIIWSSGLAGER